MDNKKAFKILLVAGVILIVVGIIFFRWRIYFGYCEKQARYLNQDEKIEIAIKSVMALYPPVIAKKFDFNGAGKVVYTKPKKYIAYSSVSDFKRKNPNCCSLSSEGKGGYEVPFFYHLIGSLSGFVRVVYLVRYEDSNGAFMSYPVETYVAISNCGSPWSGI